MSHGAADRLGAHPLDTALLGQLSRNLPIGHGLSIGNGLQDFPHAPTEGRTLEPEFRHRARLFPGKISIEPAVCLSKDGQGLLLPRRLICPLGRSFLLVRKPQAAQRLAVALHAYGSQRRLVPVPINHDAPLSARPLLTAADTAGSDSPGTSPPATAQRYKLATLP